jgi:hypothetical protein
MLRAPMRLSSTLSGGRNDRSGHDLPAAFGRRGRRGRRLPPTTRDPRNRRAALPCSGAPASRVTAPGRHRRPPRSRSPPPVQASMPHKDGSSSTSGSLSSCWSSKSRLPPCLQSDRSFASKHSRHHRLRRWPPACRSWAPGPLLRFAIVAPSGRPAYLDRPHTA